MNQEQLQELENTAQIFFNGTNPQEKASAQERLLQLGSSVQYIPQCQYVLDNSSNQLAILVAVNSLLRLVTEHWNAFSSSQRVEMSKLVFCLSGTRVAASVICLPSAQQETTS